MNRRFFLLIAALACAWPASASVRYCVGDTYLATVFDSSSAARGQGKIFFMDARKEFGEGVAFSFDAAADPDVLRCEPGTVTVDTKDGRFSFDVSVPGRVTRVKGAPGPGARKDGFIDAGCFSDAKALEVPGKTGLWYLSDAFEDEDLKRRVYWKVITLDKRQPSDVPPGALLRSIPVHRYQVLCTGDGE